MNENDGKKENEVMLFTNTVGCVCVGCVMTIGKTSFPCWCWGACPLAPRVATKDETAGRNGDIPRVSFDELNSDHVLTQATME